MLKDNFVPDPGPRAQPPSASNEILFVGHAGPEKGLDVLLAEWQRCRPAGLQLTVIGVPEGGARATSSKESGSSAG